MDTSHRVLSSAPRSQSPATSVSVREDVLSVIADVTRYPLDILTPEAELEEELGIDSVKRAEIFTVLANKFQIPETTGPTPAALRTIGDVIAAIEQFAGGSPPPAAAPAVVVPPAPAVERMSAPPPPAVAAPVTPTNGALQRRVLAIVAETTRYPLDVIQMGADLAEDLGFDRTHLAAIGAALSRELAIALPDGLPPAIRTVGDIVAVVEQASGRATATATLSRPEAPARPASAYSDLASRAKPFAGRIALVTGSGHGLGKTIARQLAGLGATVVVNSFHARQKGEDCAREIVAEGGEAVHLWGSVANTTQFEQIFAEIDRRYGALDFFISNASNGVFAPLADVKAEDWDKAFRTNVVALQRGALMAAPLMRKQGGGKIVALSANASQRYVEYFGCMGPIKAAVECLVRYLAIELGEDNIQVNAIAAGPVLGDLLDKYPDCARLRPLWEATVPRRRLNDEQEIAEAVMFLLTTSGMSGSTMLVDAGGSQRITAGPR
jgi:enoyl-[acyl-carrier protein] reductase III